MSIVSISNEKSKWIIMEPLRAVPCREREDGVGAGAHHDTNMISRP